jgi:alpha-D-ribose 1-methylphosphonate 5-triphosphate synthase subunit PhnL
MPSTLLKITDLCKTFRLHIQGGVEIEVFDGLELTLSRGEVLAVTGPSGTGKSSLLKLIYGTYRAGAGRIEVLHRGTVIDIATATPRLIGDIRRHTIGSVTQFLRAIPRVPTLDVVAEPLIERGEDATKAKARAGALLERLAIPARLWHLSPVTFSGGEQQRVNIARGLAGRHPILLIDEPTASLDAENGARVSALLCEALAEGVAMVGIFHDAATRAALATRLFRLPLKEPAA